jgi:hypothetical protein
MDAVFNLMLLLLSSVLQPHVARITTERNCHLETY